jgi:hypothetical protein
MADPTQSTDPFERSLGRLIIDASDRALRPFDASAIAQSVAERNPGPRAIRFRNLGMRRPLLAVAIVAIGAATIAGIVVTGQRRSTEPPLDASPNPPVAVVAPSQPAPTRRETPSNTPAPTASSSPGPSDATTPSAGGRPVIPTCTPQDAQVIDPEGNDGWDAVPGTTPQAHPANGLIAGFTGMLPDRTNRPNSGLIVLDPRTSTARRVADLADRVTGIGLAWSPAGNALAMSVGSGEGFGSCTAIEVLTGERLGHVTTARGGLGFSWAPDGGSIAVTSGWMRFFRSDGTAAPVPAYCGDSCWFDTPAWSPDGGRLAVTRQANDGTSQISIVSAETGAVIDEPGSTGGVFEGWLDSHTLLVMTGAFSPSGRVHWAAVGLDGSQSKPHVGVDPTAASRLSTAPDFSAAAGSECLRCPLVVSTGGTTRTVWTGKLPVSQAWSPDSRWIAFSVRGGQSTAGTWIVGVDGNGLRRISTKVLAPLAWGAAAP